MMLIIWVGYTMEQMSSRLRVTVHHMDMGPSAHQIHAGHQSLSYTNPMLKCFYSPHHLPQDSTTHLMLGAVRNW